MNCELWEVMNKDEQYARGWVRLHNSLEDVYQSARMAQYVIDLMKIKNEHTETCKDCK